MNMRLDRHSGTGMRGLPKKNGAGAKTVWGPAVDDQVPVAYLDKNDPNYDSDEEQGMFPPADFPLEAVGDMKASVEEKAVATGENRNNSEESNSSSSSAESLTSPEATDSMSVA